MDSLEKLKEHCIHKMKTNKISSSIWLEHKITFDLIEENAKLKEQIEKLKNCSNCNNQECLRIILMDPNKDKFKIVNTEECTKENHKYWRL